MEAPRILVVDDNAMARKVIGLRLSKDGYDVCYATTGTEALEAVGNGQTALVILDYKMEGLNGLETLKAMKADARTSDIPVVMISGEEEDAIRADCLGAGAAEFLNKPVEAGTLKAAVTGLIGPAG